MHGLQKTAKKENEHLYGVGSKADTVALIHFFFGSKLQKPPTLKKNGRLFCFSTPQAVIGCMQQGVRVSLVLEQRDSIPQAVIGGHATIRERSESKGVEKKFQYRKR